VPEPTARTAFSPVEESTAAFTKSKAKPQTAISSSGKADSPARSAARTGSDAAAESPGRISNSHPPATRENLLEEQENRMKGNASVGPSELRTSADSASSPARSTHPRPQAASQDSSAAQDTPAKSSDASASSDRDTNVSFESAVSSHTIAFQPAAVAFTADAVSAQPSAAQSAAPASAAFAPTPQSSAPASPAPPQVPANAAPTRGYPVDSGQLRVTANNSELKISVQLPELGKVEVRAITAHDVTTAHLTAYRHDALPALAAERTGLEQALKARDVILGSLDSHAQDSHPPGQSAGQQRQQNSPSSAQFPSGTPSVAAATISATAEAAGILPAYSSISIRA
jgi:hypothetical protein